jgi:hypothetical protein
MTTRDRIVKKLKKQFQKYNLEVDKNNKIWIGKHLSKCKLLNSMHAMILAESDKKIEKDITKQIVDYVAYEIASNKLKA